MSSSPPTPRSSSGPVTPKVTDLLAEAATAVYAVEPGEFVATRKAWVGSARAAGDREAAAAIAVLRKPSVSAWAINAVVRGELDVVVALRDLGARMRDAQSRMDMDTLQGLRKERDEVVADFVAAAARVTRAVERPLAPSGLDEVRASAVAALADASAEAAVTSGTLTRALSYSGFGEVDLHEAVVLTSTGRVLAVVEGGAGADVSAGAPTGEPTAGGEPPAYAIDDREAEEERAEEERRRELAKAARLALADAEEELAEGVEEVSAAEESLDRARAALAAAERQLSVVTKRSERLQRRRDEAATALARAVKQAVPE